MKFHWLLGGVYEVLQRIESTLKEIKQMAENINQEIQDEVAQAKANFAATQTALTNIASGVLGLDAKITALAAALASQPGTEVSQATKDAVASLVTDSAALRAQAEAVSTADPSANPTA